MTSQAQGAWCLEFDGDGRVYLSTDKVRLAEVLVSDAVQRGEAIRSAVVMLCAPEMLDLLYEVLPYIETAESDEAYKPGVVARLSTKIRAVIAKAEGRSK